MTTLSLHKNKWNEWFLFKLVSSLKVRIQNKVRILNFSFFFVKPMISVNIAKNIDLFSKMNFK